MSSVRPHNQLQLTPGARRERLWGKVLGLATTLALLALVLAVVVAVCFVMLGGGPRVVAVPDVVGRPFAEAQRILESGGLGAKQVMVVYDDKIPTGAVTSQRPPGQSRVKQGRLVELIVSQGPKSVKTPDVLGKPLDQAQQTLQDNYLRVGAVRRVASDKPEDIVTTQRPAAGTRAGREDKVDLTVSGGPHLGSWKAPDGTEWAFRLLRLTVPAGPSLQRVEIVLEDRGEENTVYDQIQRPGDKLTVELRGRKGASVRVYVEKEQVFEQEL